MNSYHVWFYDKRIGSQYAENNLNGVNSIIFILTFCYRTITFRVKFLQNFSRLESNNIISLFYSSCIAIVVCILIDKVLTHNYM